VAEGFATKLGAGTYRLTDLERHFLTGASANLTTEALSEPA
jgi:hypothetical protein